MVGEKLASLYPTEGDRPELPLGIGYNQRVEALRILGGYYQPDAVGFGGVPLQYDTFRGLHGFLDTLQPDPAIGEAELHTFVNDLPHVMEDRGFPKTAQRLLSWLGRYRQNYLDWETCGYRPVSALAQTTLDIEGQQYIIGAAGSSGGHEFFVLTEEEEQALLNESLLESLIVRGFMPATVDEDKLVECIQRVSTSILAGRRKVMPFAWSPNCTNLEEMARQGASVIATYFGQTLEGEEKYKTCLMHRYTPEQAVRWEAAGLPLPGSFGRLRCPSHCAESQALLRMQLAVQIPLLTGEPEAYVLELRHAELQVGDGMIPAMELIYVTPKVGGFRVKSLFMDPMLALGPFHPSKIYPYLSYLTPLLKEKGIKLSKYDSVGVVLNNGEVAVTTYRQTGTIPGKKVTGIEGKVLALLPWTSIRRVEVENIPVDNLVCDAVPCLHCLNTIQRRGVGNLHMAKVGWKDVKGDDGLGLEWLMTQFPGRLSVGKQVY